MKLKTSAIQEPCLPEQQRLWILDQINPGNPALNVAARWMLEGPLAEDILELAFAAIIERYPALRTSIVRDGSVPKQVIARRLPFNIQNIDLSELNDRDALCEVERIAFLEARSAFDISDPPLIRLTKLRLHENSSILLVTAHQIVFDRWSLGLLADELSAVYSALESGETVESATKLHSDDYNAKLQSKDIFTDGMQQSEDYWRRSIEGASYFELHPDRPRRTAQTFNGDSLSLLIEPWVSDKVTKLSQHCDCSVYATYLATLFALLYRYTGTTDIVIGSELSGRDNFGRILGSFAVGVLQRGDLSGDPDFLTLLARIKTAALESSYHGGIGMDRLITIINPKRDLSRNPLFSINVIVQTAAPRSPQHSGLRIVEISSCCPGTLYDLTFIVVETSEGWRLVCEYNTDLFDAETVSRMLRHYDNLLKAAAADPDCAISRMPMLDEAERYELIVERNQRTVTYPRGETAANLFETQVDRTPNAVAVCCGDESLSYRALDIAANRLAHELHSRGVARTMQVGICLERSVELVVALLAVLKAGAAYVPLDPLYPAARLQQILDDAQPAVLLTHSSFRHHLPPNSAVIIELDAEAEAIGRQAESRLQSAVTPEDLAYLIYTSGSTGRPKGVRIPHRALTNLLCSMRKAPGISIEDTLVAVTTVSFDIAALELFLPLIVGAKLVMARSWEAISGSALWQLLHRHRATLMQATPVTWQILLATGWRPDHALKMLCGGEALPRRLAEQLALDGSELWNLYGPTETTIWSSALRVTHDVGPVLIGPPIANTTFYVLDANGQLAPTGAPGELYIGGDGVAQGYHNLPQMTADRFVADRFCDRPGAKLYRTGDLVRRRNHGCLEFLGRADQQIKLRGFRIELGEIESALRSQPQVEDCVAAVSPDASGELSIRAYVVASVSEPVGSLTETLQAHLRNRLPAYMCPATIVVLKALPHTPNGKIDRAALPIPAPAQASPRKMPAQGSVLEQRLAELWCEVLGLPEVASDVNFFEVGGHSLLAVRLLTRIEAELGHQLSLAALFSNPTIAQQSKILTHGDTRAFNFRQVLTLQSSGTCAPLIAINNTGIYYALSKHLGPDQPFTTLQLFDPALPQASLPETFEDIAAGYVQLIRRIQPDGPYALLGWCVAGALAYEIAQQLTASGQHVSTLMLFDTWVPGYLKHLSWPRSTLADYAFRWDAIVSDWTKTKSSPHRLRAFLKNRNRVQKLMYWLSGRSHSQGVTAGAQHSSLNPLQYDQWLLQYLERAADAYQPRPYAGAMTLFRSSQEPHGLFLDPNMGWNAFAAGGIDVITIRGDHFSIFQEPAVSQVARLIRSLMDGSGTAVDNTMTFRQNDRRRSGRSMRHSAAN